MHIDRASSNTKKSVRIALFGAAPDTPNMGVSALFVSTVSGISPYFQEPEFVVFDNGFGRRDEVFTTVAGQNVKLIRYGARGGRRYYRSENLATMSLASKCGALGAASSEAIRLIDSCDAVLDISGGDSFSDIYGLERFYNIYRPKQIAVSRDKPLILLPQTYGPYRNPKVRELASSIVKKSAMAWARDQDSYENLQEMLGDDFDAERHRCGVDMAFGLVSEPAPHLLEKKLLSWLERDRAHTTLVGFNISGLIYHSTDGGKSQFGFKDDYRVVVERFLRLVLEETNVKVVLISHVMDQPGHYESDQAACLEVAARLGERYQDRICVSPATLNQSQVKWLISKMDWFCGTRMHSTIAALSSGVATVSLSYSDKAQGVFRSCQQEMCVVDPRRLEVDLVVERLFELFLMKNDIKSKLSTDIFNVNNLSGFQVSSLVGYLSTFDLS